MLMSFAADLAQHRAPDLALSTEALRQLTPDEQLAVLLEQARALGSVPPEIELADVRQRLRVFKANLQAVRAYTPRVFSGPIVLLRAEEAGTDLPDPTLGWGEFAALPIEVLSVPGDHYSMFALPHVQDLAKQLQAFLDIY